MNVFVNGQNTVIDAQSTVQTVVESLCGTPVPSGVAVAINSSVVPRAQWSSTVLDEGDSVEVLWASSGG